MGEPWNVRPSNLKESGQIKETRPNKEPRLLKAPRLVNFIKAEWAWLLFGSLTGVVMNTTVVLPPLILGKAVDSLLALDKLGVTPERLAAAGRYALFYFLATFIYAAGRTGKRYGFRIMAARLNCALRSDLLRNYLSWPVPRYEKERTGDLMSRAVGDVQVVADAVQVTVTEVFDTGLMMLSNLVALLLMRPGLALLAALPIPVTIFLAQALGPYIFKRATRVREAASRLNSHLEAVISGVRIFRLLGREKANQEHFGKLSDELRETNVRLALLQGGVLPLYATIASLGVVLVIALGGTQTIRGGWTVGEFTSYLTMFTAMSARTLIAARVVNRVNVGQAAWRRILPKLAPVAPQSMIGNLENVNSAESSPSAKSAMHAESLLRTEQALLPGKSRGARVDIDQLNFSFSGGDDVVISGFSLNVAPGSIVGITGPVGSGKTALALALSGLYPYEGSIIIDGRELSSLSPRERVKLIGYMGQDDFLFSSTIAENITFQPFEELDGEALRAASFRAALADDLSVFAEGYNTPVGEGGERVSGGQKQRIGLARALYLPKPLIILDDPFSAVDLATERRIIERLRDAFTNQTIFLFSHRLASFTLADQIIVMKHGAIEEQGSHEELVRADGIYARIYKAQQWMEEHGHEENEEVRDLADHRQQPQAG